MTMPPKRAMEFLRLQQNEAVQHIENETATNEGEIGGGG